MTYSIRKLTEDDFKQSMDLGMYAFNVVLSNERLEDERQDFMNTNKQLLGLFDGEKLCSQLMLHHFEFMIQGKPMLGNGVAFVSSWPEDRRNGYIAKLIERSLIEMRERKQLISVLHPFSVGFYRKFGYELFSQRIKNSMPVSYIKRVNVSGNVSRETNVDHLLELYTIYSKQYDGMLIRSNTEWDKIFNRHKPCHIVTYRDADNRKTGYLIYNVDKASMLFKVVEFVALNKEANDGLWNFIAQHDSMVGGVEWFSSYGDYQFAELQDPRINREVEQYGMARIVDVLSFIAQYRFNVGIEEEHYIVHISDQYAPWNAGLFKLTIGINGNAEMILVEANQQYESETISIDINALSGLLIGYYDSQYLIWNERIVGEKSKLAAFAKRIVKNQVQLLDYF